MNKSFTALLLLILFTLPIPEEYFLLLADKDSPFSSDPPNGYVFNSLGTVSASAVAQTALVAPYGVQIISYPPAQELQESWYVKSLVSSMIRNS